MALLSGPRSGASPGTGDSKSPGRSGGFELLSIEKSAATLVIFHMREKNSPNEKVEVLILRGSNP